MKKVLIVTRFDGKQKPGGDINLMKSFKEQIDTDFLCDLVYGVPALNMLSGYDIILALNLDRPVEGYECLKLAKQANVKFAFYALHHPDDGVRAFLKHGVKGSRKVLAFLSLFNPKLYEFYLWLIKFILHFKLALPLNNIRKSQIKLVTESDLVFFVNENEEAEVKKSLGVNPRNVEYVPHVVSSVKSDMKTVKGRVIVPGRLESRKNQIILKDIVSKFKSCEFVFIGGKSNNDSEYGEKVLSFINENNNCVYIPEMKVEDFYNYLGTADVVFSASWFEVTSLIELQTLSLGRKLVCTKYSYNESTPNMFQFDPSSYIEAESALRHALSSKAVQASCNKVQYKSIATHLKELF